MTPDSFTTQPLSRRDQFEAWRAWFAPVLDVIPDREPEAGFSAENRLWRLGGLAMTRTIAPPSHVMRDKASLRRDPVDHWVLSYCPRGAHRIGTARGSLEVPARVPFLWSLGEEFEHQRTHIDRVQLFLSRDSFCGAAPLLDAACGLALDTPLGHLLGDYMLALEDRLPDLRGEDFPPLAAAVQAIVAAAVAPSVERLAVARRQIDLGRMGRVRRVVRKHLRSPLLGPKTLSRLAGMSRSSLYRLFAAEGGVAGYIQHERLTAAHKTLTDPANSATIAAIAEDFCFADASSFGRVFKREFGHSPGDARAAALAGLVLPAGRPRRAPVGSSDFGALLHGL